MVIVEHPKETAEPLRQAQRTVIDPTALPLRVSNVAKTFGGGFDPIRALPWNRNKKHDGPRRVVDNVSFEIRRREIFGVIGANGSGKSTLIRMISTLLLPDEGDVKVFGLDAVKDAMPVRALINRVSADPSFFKSMTAMENLMFFGRVYGLSPNQIREKTPDILKRLGLEWERAIEPMSHLSRGQQQKVAVARAFLTSPTLMLLDEPTTGLDPRSKRDVQAFVRDVQQEHDATILLTTHDMEEAELLCDRIAFISGGKIVAEGTPLELRQMVAKEDDRDVAEIDMEDVFMQITGKDLAEDEEVEPVS
jgi:ABC-2 type transport system ATP-binding protein